MKHAVGQIMCEQQLFKRWYAKYRKVWNFIQFKNIPFRTFLNILKYVSLWIDAPTSQAFIICMYKFVIWAKQT